MHVCIVVPLQCDNCGSNEVHTVDHDFISTHGVSVIESLALFSLTLIPLLFQTATKWARRGSRRTTNGSRWTNEPLWREKLFESACRGRNCSVVFSSIGATKSFIEGTTMMTATELETKSLTHYLSIDTRPYSLLLERKV